MRIALVTNLPAHYRRPLFERLAERHDTDFFFTSKGREAYWPREHRLDRDGLHVGDSRQLALALARGRYDCVVTGLVGRAKLLEAVLAARMSRTPLVVWVGLWKHPETLAHRLSRPLTRAILRRADALVVYGSHVAAHVRAESGRATHVFESCQSVDNEAFRAPVPADAVARLRSELGLGLRDAPVACFVGRLEREKGLEVLVDALALTDERLQLLVVGSGSAEEPIRERAEALGLGGRVAFAGYVPQEDLALHLRAADFLVVPSVSTRRFKEPWGLVANEAMNCGLPVIATDAVGAAAGGLVVDGETGLVVHEGDREALAAAMDALAGDLELRRRLGERAREHVLAWNYERALHGFEQAVRAACAS